MSSEIQRSILPIPDQVQPALTTFDAKDPDTKYPPIRPIHPPAGAESAASCSVVGRLTVTTALPS